MVAFPYPIPRVLRRKRGPLGRTFILKRCVFCKVKFWRRFRGKRPGAFCSKACILRYRFKIDPGYSSRVARKCSAARGDAQRGKGTKHPYVKLNGRHMHRVIAERIAGRRLLSSEVVHHKDGNSRNNDPSNLIVLSRAEHMREHGLGIKGKTLHWKPWIKSAAVRKARKHANV